MSPLRPHYRTEYLCGHAHSQCACGLGQRHNKPTKPTRTLNTHCPACRALLT